MIKENENIQNKIQSNIKLLKIETKKYLYSSPYENVLKVLNALKDYISSINNNNNNNALEELDWVINIISKHLLYNYEKTTFYKKNIDIINGSHKIANFSHEVQNLNKEYDELYKKYIQIRIKNEEYSKSLSFIEKKISSINNCKNVNIAFNYEQKIKPIGIMENPKRLDNNLLSQFPINLLNDYNKYIYDNNSFSNINSTDFNGNKHKSHNKLNNNIISYKKRNVKQLSIDSQSSSKNKINKKSSIFNNYRINSSANTNVNNSINRSFPKQRKKVRAFGKNNYANNNNVQLLEKIISLPIIQFNFNGGVKYKVNLFNRKLKDSPKNKKKENEEGSSKKLVTFGKDINVKISKIPLYLTSGIEIDSLFDFQNFDIFTLKERVGLENVMPFLGKEIMKKINIIQLLEESKLDNFLMVISKTYQNTKALYHTSLHGVDVCYSTLMILTYLKNDENKIENISEIDIVSLIISALCHDIGHPGLTNKFMINSKNELSIIYNDTSVLENFHCAKTFQLLENNEINIFSNFSNEDYLLLRKKMIGEILSTDIALHFKIVSEYKEYKNNKNKDKKLEQYQLNFITHIADLFHNYKKFEISLKWVELLSNEFWNQGDREKELGLSISFLCDREDVDIPKSQIGFINTFTIPPMEEFVDINIKFNMFKNNAINNLNIWKKLQKEKRKKGWSPENN